MAPNRQYELVVFGATGYTGKLTTEHIATHLPTDLRWALAGRSASKLEALAAEIKSLSSERVPPAIEICNLNDDELASLAKRTTLLITTVGPYALYGEHAFKACAENGTHYLDVTGEVPWHYDMIKKYEKTAQASGSIMIPQIGIDSAPADLVTWKIVDLIRERFSASTAEVVVSVYDVNGKPSGGTLETVFTLMDVYSLQQMRTAHAPYSLSPIPAPKSSVSDSYVTKLFGLRVVPDLGILTTSLGGMVDAPLVQRSWGLLGGPKGYGPNFCFVEAMKARNHLTAVLFHFALALGSLLLSIPFLRKSVRKYFYQPGDGPTKEQTKNDRIDYRGIGTADIQTPNPPRAYCRASFEGSLYLFTGISLAQAAMTILRDNHNLKGGIYTPAALGQHFIDRLNDAGFNFETKIYE